MEALLRLLVEFFAELLRGIAEAIVRFDAPHHLTPTQRAALYNRTAPWRITALTVTIIYGLWLIVLIAGVCVAPQLPLPAFTCVVLGQLSYLAVIGGAIALLCLLSSRCRFGDFHAAVGLVIELGPRGFAIALTLLQGLLLFIAVMVAAE